MAEPRKSRRALFFLCVKTALVSALIGLVLAQLIPAQDNEPLTSLRLNLTNSPLSSRVVADDLLLKYATANRLDSFASSIEPVSIFIHYTAVQVPTRNGWKTISEEQRNEIWRLKPGVIHQVCVERPQAEGWRVVVSYGKEMHGLDLFCANLQEAWLRRSFSNWNGKAWGGGKFGGRHEFVSEQIFSE